LHLREKPEDQGPPAQAGRTFPRSA
jgi:hypothetical protein